MSPKPVPKKPAAKKPAAKKPAAERPAPKQTSARPAPKAKLPIFWIAVGAIVAIVVGLIIVSAAGDDTKKSSNNGGGGGRHEYGKVVVTGDALAEFPESGDDPAIGETIPTVKGENFSGQPVTIAPNGRPQMIVFLAHWCPHCNVEAPRLADYLRTNGGVPDGVDLTIVPTGSSDEAPKWPPSQWVEDMKLGGLTTLVDDKAQSAAVAFGLSSYPYIVTVDANGAVVERFAGEQPDGFFTRAFDALAAGEPIPAG